jgi:membrane protease YdiL (CAAX protease family)
MKWIFVGSNGIRAGWRLALFAAIFVTLAAAVHAVTQYVLHLPRPPQSRMLFPIVGVAEAVVGCLLIVTAFAMSKIERRPFDAYGLPLRGVLRSRLWIGLLWGFAAVCVVLLGIFALHGFRIDGIATSGADLLVAALIWTPTFFLVALAEEFALRGYGQYTLGSGIGFWPAAAVISVAFAAGHLHNEGETAFGVAQLVLFALVMVVSLRQTGSLWLGIGFHAGWDWGLSFFFGVPDSGTTTWHTFLSSTSSGPAWLTGGTAGPEGSIFSTLVYLGTIAILLWRFPKSRDSRL